MLSCATRTSDVLCVGNRLKVIRPYATAHAAEVIPFEPGGRSTGEKMMGQRGALATSTDTKLPVALSVGAAHPKGATISPTGIHLAPKTLRGWRKKCNERVAVGLPSLVVPMAPTSRDDSLATSIYRTCRSGWICVKGSIKGSLGLHREPILSGVTVPDVSASRHHSILPQLAVSCG